MKRSFKLQLFLCLFLITAAIIGTNRLIAQHFLISQLNQRIQQEMGEALSACIEKYDDRGQFLSCFKDRYPGGLVSNVSDFYVLCQKGRPARGPLPTDECPEVDVMQFWAGVQSSVVSQVDLSQGKSLSSDVWFAARFADQSDGPEVWIRETDADKMIDQMWALRDRNLFRVIPIIILMLVLMTLFMMRVIMRPITSIETNMLQLNATNLDRSSSYRAPYREFEKLVDVFEGLRVRLNEGFIKARRFASDASHELRTPLTILRGQAEQLIHETPTGSDMQIRARTIGDEVERLIDITEKLLLLSRADANNLLQQQTDVNVSGLLQDLIHEARSFQTGIQITSDIQKNVIWHCDRTLVNQLIQNLYSNAVNYNLPGGWIHLTLEASEGHLHLSIENPTKEAPADLADRAFDRFYRGDASHARQVDGLGLGLSICSEIAHLHQGVLSLTVSSHRTILLHLKAPLRA